MRYVSADWEPGDVAMVTGRTEPSSGPILRMLIVRRQGDHAGRRLWWGVNSDGLMGYHREDSIIDIERVHVFTADELGERNEREGVNP